MFKKTLFIFVKITYSLGEPYIWPFNFIVKPQLHSNYYYTNWTRPFWGHFPILYELWSTAATSRNAVTIYCRVSILHMGYLVYILLTEYAKIPHIYNNIRTHWWGRRLSKYYILFDQNFDMPIWFNYRSTRRPRNYWLHRRRNYYSRSIFDINMRVVWWQSFR